MFAIAILSEQYNNADFYFFEEYILDPSPMSLLSNTVQYNIKTN